MTNEQLNEILDNPLAIRLTVDKLAEALGVTIVEDIVHGTSQPGSGCDSPEPVGEQRTHGANPGGVSSTLLSLRGLGSDSKGDEPSLLRGGQGRTATDVLGYGKAFLVCVPIAVLAGLLMFL